MTIREILVKNDVFEQPEISNFNLMLSRDGHIKIQQNIEKSMIEFAKLKCQELLEIVAEKAKVKEISYVDEMSWVYNIEVDVSSILNAVDLNEFIK